MSESQWGICFSFIEKHPKQCKQVLYQDILKFWDAAWDLRVHINLALFNVCFKLWKSSILNPKCTQVRFNSQNNSRLAEELGQKCP